MYKRDNFESQPDDLDELTVEVALDDKAWAAYAMARKRDDGTVTDTDLKSERTAIIAKATEHQRQRRSV